jgi:hypothetical protein
MKVPSLLFFVCGVLTGTDSDHSTVQEVKRGEVVWQFFKKDIWDYKCFTFQGADQLENGNTEIRNWCLTDVKNIQKWPVTVRMMGVMPAKKAVWAFNEWKDPDPELTSSIQSLDEPGAAENGGLQRQ